MKKSYKRGDSRRLRGGNRLARFLGFGKPAPIDPGDAQAQQVAAAQDDEVAGLQQMTDSKQQQASTLRDQCQGYQHRAEQLDQEAAEHMNATAEIARNRESKNRCDQEHAMRLQGIEQDYQQMLDELTQQHNTALAQENQRAQEQHAECLREGMRLSNAPIAAAQQQRNNDMNAAAAALQAQRRGQLGRRSTTARAQAQQAADPLISMIGGRKSRRRRRKSRRGGVHCGSHKKKKYGSRKSRRRSRKSRRGGVHCGSHKNKIYGGRRSRRGGTKCSPKSGKKCSYYKKYGYHHYM
tara:strand:+ start:2133 stop:3017 length:885 start_codon:yes stop_codon:yes gene_type:complete